MIHGDPARPEGTAARLRWLGHAAFAIATPTTRLLLDPHRPGALGGRFRLPAIVGPFDAIACSHGHDDHAAWSPAFGTQRWIEADESVGDLRVRFLAAAHDRHGGRRMGLTRMIAIEGPGWRVVHSGDLGVFGDREVAFARRCDLLLVAAGGTYTLDGAEAAAFCRAVAPAAVAPMHCADPAIDLALAPVTDFVAALGWPTIACPDWRSERPQPAQPSVLLFERPAGVSGDLRHPPHQEAP